MIASLKTKYNADSIEARPGKCTQFACATYQLDPSTDKRNGNISLFQFGDSLLRETSAIETGGVLDLWWKDENVLFAAKASGELQSFTLNKDEELTVNSEIKVSDSILLAVDGNSDCVVSSDTSGNIFKVDADTMKISQTIESTHGGQGWGSEVWGVALNRHNADLVYSGGDDCLLKCHDLRSAVSVFTCKHHQMGVCCISPDPLSEHYFISGSYDEAAVLWDSRSMRSYLQKCGVGGGVWRAKRASHNSRLLIAGMHSGFHVIDLASFQITNTYTHHTSLAYGADWLGEGLAATCSFYDNLVTVWGDVLS